MTKVGAFLRLSRLHFLIGGLVAFGLGALTAGDIDWGHYVAGQLMITAAQITAHYVNEYADFYADQQIRNRTSFSGGSGVLASGELPRSVALYAGFVSTVISVAFIVVVAGFSLPAAGVGAAALAVSWAYSMPPVRLLDTGTGELATAVTVGALVPMAGALVQASTIAPALWWSVVALAAMQFAMLLAFELPDLETDAAAGKRVLGVRIGMRPTIATMTGAVAVAVAVVAIGYTVGDLPARSAAGAAFALVPAAGMLLAARPGRHARSTLLATATFLVTMLGLMAGFV